MNVRNATCVGTQTSKVPTRVVLLFILYTVLRTMRLFDENNKFFDHAKIESGNFIHFQKDERIIILQMDFKTSKTTGNTNMVCNGKH